MKKLIPNLLSVALASALLPAVMAQDTFVEQPVVAESETPNLNPNNNGATEVTNGEPVVDQQTVAELMEAVVEAQRALEELRNGQGNTGAPIDRRTIRGAGTRGSRSDSPTAVDLSSVLTNAAYADEEKNIRLNFREASLSLVLNYLSEAAGFTISPDSKVDLNGTITAWANQPVGRKEAVAVLNKALTAKNYGATLDGNVLDIFVVDPTTSPIVPPIAPNDYVSIPPTKDLVTQIVYVRNVEASQLISSLESLMPPGTSMRASQGANAIIITDTKATIRRMAQLVSALDTASVSASTVRVFPLTYADATAVAQVIQQVFQQDSNNNQGGRGGRGGPGAFFNAFRGGDQGGDRGNGGSASSGRIAAPRVVASADERSNSLVVGASEEQMGLIETLVQQLDVNVSDFTELRVFRLRYADPQETADQLTNLFADSNNTQQNNRRPQFGRFGNNNNRRNNNNNQSNRTLEMARVTAVADARTGSVIVSAAREMMLQIEAIIQDLDADPSKQRKVYVIKVENRDPQEVMEELTSVIATDNSGNFNSTRNTSRQNNSTLNQRQQNNNQNVGNNNTFGGGFGTGGGGTRTGR